MIFRKMVVYDMCQCNIKLTKLDRIPRLNATALLGFLFPKRRGVDTVQPRATFTIYKKVLLERIQ